MLSANAVWDAIRLWSFLRVFFERFEPNDRAADHVCNVAIKLSPGVYVCFLVNEYGVLI